MQGRSEHHGESTHAISEAREVGRTQRAQQLRTETQLATSFKQCFETSTEKSIQSQCQNNAQLHRQTPDRECGTKQC